MTRLLRILIPFLVTTAAFAQTADLHITGHLTDQRPAKPSFLFAFLNNGPDVARKTVLTVDLPEGVTVERFSFGGGDVVRQCDTTRRPMRCEAGDLHVGAPFHYGGFDLSVPLASAQYSVTISLSSETPDEKTSNNSSTISWETRIEADLDVLVRPEGDRVDPGMPARFNAWICNETRDNVPPSVRAELSLTNGVITSITPPNGFTCSIDGASAVCTSAAVATGCPGHFVVAVRTNESRAGGEARLTVRATGNISDRNPDNNAASNAIPIYRWLAVTSAADAGPGSLREAMTLANEGCTPGPCRIIFEIPGPVPAEGWFTITPSEPLPAITADRVTLEGSRQIELTGDTNPKGPEIAIDGRLAGRGLKLLTRCEGVVEGLAIGNFEEDHGLWVSTGGGCGTGLERREVLDNHIGVDPSGEVRWPNLRGLRGDGAATLTVSRNTISYNRFSGIWMWNGAANITRNRIEHNGASGVFLGAEVVAAIVNDNVIGANAHMGVAAARTAQSVQIRRNSMKANTGLGIDWALDGVSPANGDDHGGPSNAPVLLSAVYDAPANRTAVTLSLTSTRLGPYVNFGTLEFYANDAPDGDGERYLHAHTLVNTNGTNTLFLAGDHRGKWINATWTREHHFASRPPDVRTQSHSPEYAVMTSELSNTVLVN
jgi:parallel beta-helix repeat protein